MTDLTERDLKAVAKAFGQVFTLHDMFTMAEKAEERMQTDSQHRRSS